MYSIVMIAAMTAAPETPEFNGFFRNLFHRGSSGCSGSCYGSGCGGCSGYARGCTGCWGSGYSCHGYVTISSGCTGCTGYTSCTGCTGYTSCTGQVPYYTGCSGYGTYSSGCSGCGGYTSGYTSSSPIYSGYTQPATPSYSGYSVGYTPATGTTPVISGSSNSVETPEAVSTLPTNRAQLTVRVPVDAKLFADGHATALSGEQRSFMTPEITNGRDYQYTLKIEYTENGETKSQNRQVVVRAGHRTAVDFTGTTSEQASSPVIVKLPENAKLYVDGLATAAKGGQHTFRTPNLPRGESFTYQFRAEFERDGKTETQTEKVVFKAGEPVAVDFTKVNTVRTASK